MRPIQRVVASQKGGQEQRLFYSLLLLLYHIGLLEAIITGENRHSVYFIEPVYTSPSGAFTATGTPEFLYNAAMGKLTSRLISSSSSPGLYS